jgi:hypothetical protein
MPTIGTPKLFKTLLRVPKVREDIATIKFLIKAFDQRCWKWKFACFFQAIGAFFRATCTFAR